MSDLRRHWRLARRMGWQGRLATACGLALLGATAGSGAYAATAAQADEPPLVFAGADPFSALVGERRRDNRRREARSDVERFVIAADDRAFLFENLGQQGRIRFLCRDEGDPRMECRLAPGGGSEEIMTLAPTRAPRGDTIYKDGDGETVLRMAAYGGATVFWPGDPVGHAASRSFAEGATFDLAPLTPADAEARARTASAIISAKLGAAVVFAPPAEEAADSSVLGDAIIMAAKAIDIASEDPALARILANRLQEVRFRAAPLAGVDFAEGVLFVDITPSAGVDGRPSSVAIKAFIRSSI